MLKIGDMVSSSYFPEVVEIKNVNQLQIFILWKQLVKILIIFMT